jgi:hypothetical protein
MDRGGSPSADPPYEDPPYEDPPYKETAKADRLLDYEHT